MAHEKRRPFKGKIIHKDLRDYKNQEIKRSLVHRARLRKNYFKLLEKEGIPIENKKEIEGNGVGGEENSEVGLRRKSKKVRKSEVKSGESESELAADYGSDSDSNSDEEEFNGSSNEIAEDKTAFETPRKRHGAPLPPQQCIRKPREVVKRKTQPKRKPLNFFERAKLAKERKEQKREEELSKVQERRRKIEKSQRQREQKKLSLQKRTKRGQPVMGPKINDLLEKIKQNS